MILLDTNVLSALMLRQPDATILRWLDHQPHSSIWTSSISIFEIRLGIYSMEPGKRRSMLASTFEHVLDEVVEERIATLDGSAADHSARLMAERVRKGRPRDLRDTMIAGIALSFHATLVTRNLKHFDDIGSPVVNPWDKG
jgi:toxin FitB